MTQFSELQSSVVEGVRIFFPKGILDYSSTLKLLETITSHFSQNDNKLIIDMQQVDYINSAGYSILSLLFVEAKKSGIRLLLCGLKEMDRKNLALLKFPDIENTFSTQQEALSKIHS